MKQKISRSRCFFFMDAIVVFFFQLAILFAVSQELVGIVAFFWVQAIVFGANAATALILRSSAEAFSAFLQLAYWALIAGPFGAVIGAGLGGFDWSRERSSSDIGGWLEEQIASKEMKQIQHLRNELLDHRLRIK